MSLKKALRMSGPSLEDFPSSGELFFRQTSALTQAQGLKNLTASSNESHVPNSNVFQCVPMCFTSLLMHAQYTGFSNSCKGCYIFYTHTIPCTSTRATTLAQHP